MVELQVYLMAQSHNTPWPMRPKETLDRREPIHNRVEADAAKELMGGGFIEATSSQTFVVSKSGCQFYEQQIKFRISA
jgi:hypothetical protein